MKEETIAACAVRVLKDAGADGLPMTELRKRVSDLRRVRTSRETLAIALANFRGAHPDGASLVTSGTGTGKRYAVVVETEHPPDSGPGPIRVAGSHRSLTALLLGDPLPGHSALDQRRGAASEAR